MFSSYLLLYGLLADIDRTVLSWSWASCCIFLHFVFKTEFKTKHNSTSFVFCVGQKINVNLMVCCIKICTTNNWLNFLTILFLMNQILPVVFAYFICMHENIFCGSVKNVLGRKLKREWWLNGVCVLYKSTNANLRNQITQCAFGYAVVIRLKVIKWRFSVLILLTCCKSVKLLHS